MNRRARWIPSLTMCALACASAPTAGCGQLVEGLYDPGHPMVDGHHVEEVSPDETDDLFILDNTVVLDGCDLHLTVYWGGQVEITREGSLYTLSSAEIEMPDGLLMLAEGHELTTSEGWSEDDELFGCPIRFEFDHAGEITSTTSLDLVETNTLTELDSTDEDCWIPGGSCGYEVSWELVAVQ